MAAVVLVALAACGRATPSSEPSAPPPSVNSAQSVPTASAPPPTSPQPPTPHEPPDSDLFELALRLRPNVGGSGSRIANASPVGYKEGHQETFWVLDQVDVRSYPVGATLKLVSEHAYWYVDDDLDLSMDDLRRAAEAFESEIHPTITGLVGDIWSPGVDNDPRLTILHTPLRGAGGYFGSQDEYPRQVHPRSNQREMIYMDGGRLRPGSHTYLGVLAHELQHAVHWNLDAGEDSWVNEGMSEVAKELAGYRAGFVESFLLSPDTQLNYWPEDPNSSASHYGAATLFLSYLAQHYGGYEGLRALAQEQADGINGVEAYLRPYGKSFLDVFKDWTVANYLDEPEGLFGYGDRQVRVRGVELIFDYGEREGTLPQFAARYIDVRLPGGAAAVGFRGQAEVAQVGTRCHSGRYCWWGDGGDSIDSTLTREFDLSGLDVATLEFWAWFEIEEGWDYAYVEVSTDGGKTWTVLEGRHTTSVDPVGNSFGHGYTGASGQWVHESIDLSPYVGGVVLLRFEYVTDDAVYLDGFVVDDVTIPELGFFDDAEQNRGWSAAGFARIDNRLPQGYAVQVIELRADGEVLVRDLELKDDAKGQALIEGFGSEVEHAVIVVSPVARGTHQPARYTLTVAPAEGR